MSRLYRVVVTTRIVTAFDVIATSPADAKASVLEAAGTMLAAKAAVSRSAYVQRVRSGASLVRYNYVNCD